MADRPAPPPGFTVDEPPPGFVLDRAPDAPENPASHLAMQPFYGFNRGLMETLRTPGDYAEGALGSLGIELPDWLTEPVLDTSGIEGRKPGQEPRGAAGEIAQRSGLEVGRTVPYLAAPYLAKPAQFASQAGRVAGPLLSGYNTFLAGVHGTPAKALIGEVLAASGAGVGAGVAQEAAPGNQWAEMGGQLVGGLTPGAFAFLPAVQLLRGSARRLSPDAQRGAAERHVAKELGEAGGYTAGKRLAEAERIRGRIPGFDPTLAEATGAPSLIAHQKYLEGSQTGNNLNEVAKRRRQSEEAVAKFGRQAGPRGDADPELVYDTVRGRVNELRTGVETEAQTIARQAEVGDTRADLAEQGRVIRDRLWERRNQTKQQMNELAEMLDLNSLDVTKEFAPVKQKILNAPGVRSFLSKKREEFEDSYKLLRDAPETVETTPLPGSKMQREALAEGGVPGELPTEAAVPKGVTFEDLKALREEIGEDYRAALRASDQEPRRIAALSLMRKAVDEEIEALAVKGGDPELVQRYQQFRETYYKDYINVYEGGVAYKVRQEGRGGHYRTPDERVGSAFFKAGNVDAAKAFKRAFGNDPEANEALSAVALDSFIEKAVVNGRVDPAKAQKWMRQHESVLKEYGYTRVFEEPTLLAEGLAARQAALTSRQRDIETSLLAKTVNRVATGEADPQALIDRAIKNPVFMDEVLKGVKGTDAEPALRRAVWETVIDGTPDQIDAFLRDNSKSLKKVFTKQHLSDIKDIVKAGRMHARTPAPRGRGGLPTPLEVVEREIGQGMGQIGSRAFAVASGRIGRMWMAVDFASRFIRGRSLIETERLFQEALYDPEVARDLADMITHKINIPEERLGPMAKRAGMSKRQFEKLVQPSKQAQARRLNTRLFVLGYGPSEEQDMSQPPHLR